MNQELIRLTNRLGAVSNENGKIDIVEKANDSYDFTDILNKENDLEIINKDLSHNKDNLTDVQHKIIISEFYNITLYTLEILLFLFLHTECSLNVTLLVNLLTYLPYKGVILLTYGTRLSKLTKKSKLKEKIQDLLVKKSQVEEELQLMQEKTKYQKHASINNYKNQIFIYSLETDNLTEGKNKVLSLKIK